MAHWAFMVNLILVLILSDYRGPIYMGSNMTPWVPRVLNLVFSIYQFLFYLYVLCIIYVSSCP